MSETWAMLEQPICNGGALLTDVILKFGNFPGLIPYSSSHISQAHALQTSAVSELNFYHLHRLGGIKICWVDFICQHLEFNRQGKHIDGVPISFIMCPALL